MWKTCDPCPSWVWPLGGFCCPRCIYRRPLINICFYSLNLVQPLQGITLTWAELGDVSALAVPVPSSCPLTEVMAPLFQGCPLPWALPQPCPGLAARARAAAQIHPSAAGLHKWGCWEPGVAANGVPGPGSSSHLPCCLGGWCCVSAWCHTGGMAMQFSGLMTALTWCPHAAAFYYCRLTGTGQAQGTGSL